MERGWRSGPRLPSDHSRRLVSDDDIADPAKGERVPRCGSCGLPDQPASRLMDFALFLGGRRAGHYLLCERCWMAQNPPPRADPLDASEAA